MNTISNRVWILLGLAIISGGVLYFMDPIPQDPLYHNFADSRSWLGVPNFWNVLSNLPFAIFGLMGFLDLWKRGRSSREETQIHFFFYLGVFLTAFGSGYYHWAPSTPTLFWDRLPMTVAFMSLFSMLLYERVDEKMGQVLLYPLLFLGVFSVWIWREGEQLGFGDLRLYAFVQYFPMLAIPLIVWLFPARYTRTGDLLVAGGWYVLAKLLEYFDGHVFVGDLISGHSLKHVAAAMGTYWLVRMVQKRDRIALHAATRSSMAG